MDSIPGVVLEELASCCHRGGLDGSVWLFARPSIGGEGDEGKDEGTSLC